MSVALVTGGSAGLGRELVHTLADRGWTVITDARHTKRLEEVWRDEVVVLPGDVTDPAHRADLAAAVEESGGLDLLVHNASTLGPLPMRTLAEADDLEEVWRTNVVAPFELTRLLLPALRDRAGVLLSVTSDAAAEHYETWGPYGATKAALEHLTLTFGAENEPVTAYVVDPGDMRTQMHQDAFPGEDISDRPLPTDVVPHLLALLDQRLPSGRYRAADIKLLEVSAR